MLDIKHSNIVWNSPTVSLILTRLSVYMKKIQLYVYTYAVYLTNFVQNINSWIKSEQATSASDEFVCDAASAMTLNLECQHVLCNSLWSGLIKVKGCINLQLVCLSSLHITLAPKLYWGVLKTPFGIYILDGRDLSERGSDVLRKENPQPQHHHVHYNCISENPSIS